MAAGTARLPTQHASLIGEDGTTPRAIGCTTSGALHTYPHGTLELEQDNTFDDSLKSFSVPAGEVWIIHWITINFSSTATAGNRLLRVTLQPLTSISDVFIESGVNHPASTVINYTLFPGAPKETAFVNSALLLPLPTPCILPPAGLISILDSASIAVAADDMLVAVYHSTILI